MDVAAPKPKSNGKAIIFAKFKLMPSTPKKYKVNKKAAIKFTKTMKTFLKFLNVKIKNKVVKNIEAPIAYLKDLTTSFPAS